MFGLLLLVSGCSGERYDLDLTCQRLRKDPDGQVVAEAERTYRTFSPAGTSVRGGRSGRPVPRKTVRNQAYPPVETPVFHSRASVVVIPSASGARPPAGPFSK